MSEAISQPTEPQFVAPTAFPEHFHVAQMLQADEAGRVPYADVAFDVGPEAGGASAGRFLAHRIIVASESAVLMQELSKLPLTHLPREDVHAAVFRVDPRISKEVWRSALQFMYTGVINVTFTADAVKMVELLRACVAYQLPQPLLEFAQAALYPLLPSSPPEIALQVFSIVAGSASEDVDLSSAREASTYILLRSAHKLFESMDAKETCQILEKVVQSVEQVVFKPQAAAAAAAAASAAQQEAQQAQAQAEQAAAAGAMTSGDARQQAQMMMQGGPGMDRMAHSMGNMQAYQEQMMMMSRGAGDPMAQSMGGNPRANGPEMQAYQQEMMRRAQADPMAQSMGANGQQMQEMAYQQEMMRRAQAAADPMSQSMGNPLEMANRQEMQAYQEMMMRRQAAADPMSQSVPSQDPRMQDPRMQDPRMQDPRMQDPRMQDPRMQDPRMQDPRIQDPRMQDPRMQDPRMQDPRFAQQGYGQAQGQMQDPRMQASAFDPGRQPPNYGPGM